MSQDEARSGTAATPALAAVGAAVGAPAFVFPWLDRFYDGDDVGVLLAGGRAAGLASAAPELLERAVRRAVLDRDDAGAYAPAAFADRLDICAMFEGWRDIPATSAAAWPTGRRTTTPPRSATTSRR